MRMEKERKSRKQESISKDRKNKQNIKTEKEYKKISPPISWQFSEGMYHIFDAKPFLEKEKMTGLYEGREISNRQKMEEMFRLENSYGNIAFGANKKKEAIIVVSQKREHNEETTNENQKELQMERAERTVSSRGEFLQNQREEKEGAAAYHVDLKMCEQKIIPQLKDYTKKKENAMFEKRMPFLSLDRDIKDREELAEHIRVHREKGEKIAADRLEKQKERLQRTIQQKEEQEKIMKKRLKFAWKKMQRLSGDEIEQIHSRKRKVKLGNLEEGAGEDVPVEKMSNKHKKCKK